MAAVCVAIFCLGQKGTRKKIFFYAGYWLEWFWGNNYQVEREEKQNLQIWITIVL